MKVGDVTIALLDNDTKLTLLVDCVDIVEDKTAVCSRLLETLELYVVVQPPNDVAVDVEVLLGCTVLVILETLAIVGDKMAAPLAVDVVAMGLAVVSIMFEFIVPICCILLEDSVVNAELSKINDAQLNGVTAVCEMLAVITSVVRLLILLDDVTITLEVVTLCDFVVDNKLALLVRDELDEIATVCWLLAVSIDRLLPLFNDETVADGSMLEDCKVDDVPLIALVPEVDAPMTTAVVLL